MLTKKTWAFLFLPWKTRKKSLLDYLVSKYSLIKFLASDKGFAMQPKSEWHEKAIKWFVEVMHK